MGGYLAGPAEPGSAPGVLIGMELFGIAGHVRDVCDRLAGLGFLALAPDLYHRSAPGIELAEDNAGRERGFALLHQLTREQALADIAAGVEYLFLVASHTHHGPVLELDDWPTPATSYVRGLERISGTLTEIAARLRREIREQVGLPVTVGIARTKFLAKVASAVAKPDGLLLVEPDAELAFLHPLPVERLWGVGRVTAAKLHRCGLTTVRQVAELSEPALVAILGRAGGRHLHALAHNHDPRPVHRRPRRRSIGAQRALGSRRRPRSELAVVLTMLVDRVTRRMRRARRACRTVVLRFRFSDYTRATRSHTMPESTASTATILAVATALLTVALPEIDHRGLTLIGVALTNLSDEDALQLTLPFDRARELGADATFEPGQHQQIRDQRRQMVSLVHDVFDQIAVVCHRPRGRAQQHLGVGADQRERRTQLVRGVGHERLLPLPAHLRRPQRPPRDEHAAHGGQRQSADAHAGQHQRRVAQLALVRRERLADLHDVWRQPVAPHDL